jgi:hypothetical protein
MYQFKGVMKNELRPEPGLNIVVKGLEEERIILAPTGPWREFDKQQDGNTLKLNLYPSAGNTDYIAIKIEITNGTEKTTTQPDHWEVELTASSDSEPAAIDLVIDYAEEEE